MASYTASELCFPPVCISAAIAPALVLPVLMAITGLENAAARAAEIKLRISLILSMYSNMALVLASRPKKSSISSNSISKQSPIDTKYEKPISLFLAQSRIVEQTAADCDTKASLPGVATVCEKLAFKPICGISNPKQFEPSRVTLCFAALSLSACF